MDNDQKQIGVVKVTRVEVLEFKDVPTEFALAEAEGDLSVDDFRHMVNGEIVKICYTILNWENRTQFRILIQLKYLTVFALKYKTVEDVINR